MNTLTYGEACATVIERCGVKTVLPVAEAALAVQNEDDRTRGQHAQRLLSKIKGWANQDSYDVRKTLILVAQVGGYCVWPECGCSVATPFSKCKRGLEI